VQKLCWIGSRTAIAAAAILVLATVDSANAIEGCCKECPKGEECNGCSDLSHDECVKAGGVKASCELFDNHFQCKAASAGIGGFTTRPSTDRKLSAPQ